MSLWDGIKRFMALEPWQERSIDTFDPTTDFATQLAAIQGRARPWRLPSITEALGVPAIQRAVTLIANTTGSLALVAYRNGERMALTPRLVVRPDPFSTPRDFYRDSSYCLATRGEAVLWIATRDGQGFATALVVVPPAELKVEENPRNRLLPTYAWGTIKGTRYSPANPEGDFVHITYLREPMALRGTGPLQLAGAAASVSVEAQEWAANFYAAGGYPSIELHSEVDLSKDESDALKAQWINTPSNMPKVTSGALTTKEIAANPQGAQMLQAREYQNGDAARMFGIPGSLLEYSTPGSSLTYQNLEGEYTKFVRTCLAPNYLEPIEQALTDLMPRSIVIRFSVDGLLRADIKTRFEVYKTGIESGVLTPAFAQEREGILPGDIENAPVPQSPPAAIPAPLQNRSQGEVRCDGMRLLRGRVTTCGKLLAEAGPFTGTCPRCGKVYVPSPEPAPVITRTLLPVRMPEVRRAPVEVPVEEPRPERESDEMLLIRGMAATMTTALAMLSRPQAPAPPTFSEGAIQVHSEPAVVNVAAPEVSVPVTIERGAVESHFHAGDVNLPAPEVTVENTIEPTPVTVENTVEPTPVEVRNEITVEPTPIEVRNSVKPTPITVNLPKSRTTKTIVRDDQNQIVKIVEESD